MIRRRRTCVMWWSNLPPGLVGNPQPCRRAPHASFEGGTPDCSAGTQIGVLHAVVPGLGEILGPAINLTPPPGVVALDRIQGWSSTRVQYVSVRSERRLRRERLRGRHPAASRRRLRRRSGVRLPTPRMTPQRGTPSNLSAGRSVRSAAAAVPHAAHVAAASPSESTTVVRLQAEPGRVRPETSAFIGCGR